jgi:hypothetical protein
MLKFKDRNEIIYNAFLVCLVQNCQEEALKLWPTETNIVDVCEEHFRQLQLETLK